MDGGKAIIMQLNTFSRLLLKLLFLYVLFVPAVYALNVVLTVTPTEGASPLSVQVSAQQTIASPGEAIFGYKWQVNGPENIVLAGFLSHIITLNKVGQYTITLTVEETTRGGLGFSPGERRSQTVSKMITVRYPSVPIPSPTTTPITQPTTPINPTPTPNATFTYSPRNPIVNQNVTLRVNNPSPGVAYTWDVSPPLQGQSLSGIEVTVRFPNAIFYDVTLKVNGLARVINTSNVKSSQQPASNGDNGSSLIDKTSKPTDEGSTPSTTTPDNNQDISVSRPKPQIQIFRDGIDKPIIELVYVDFGTAIMGSSVDPQKFTIRNVGNIPLELNGPEFKKPSEGFAITYFTKGLIVGEEKIEKVENQKFVINPQENLKFSILLNVAKEGNFSNDFIFLTNDSSTRFIEFRLNGTVEPAFVPPTASFTYTPSQWVPATLFLDASSSKADNGLKIVEYVWNTEKKTPEITNEPFTYMTFSKGGVHRITLTVTDDIGQINSFGYYVTIPTLQHNPVPRFTIAKNKQRLLLDASDSFDPDDGKIESYKWSSNVTSTKNSPEKGQLNLSDSQTNYSISLQVKDNEGHLEDITTQITVDKNGEPQILPVANFHVEFEGQNVKVLSTMGTDISNSFHPYGGEILGYEWFLGTDISCKTRDENKQDVLDVDDQNTPIHKIKFTKGGIYYLCLQVTDNLLNSSVKGKRVSVTNDYSSSPYMYGGFRGGLLVKNEFLPNEATLSGNIFMDIVAEITIDSQIFTEATLNVYVVAEYKATGATNSQFFMKDEEIANFRILEDWNDLRPAFGKKTFKADRKLYISLFSNQLANFPGVYKFFIAYNVSFLPPLDGLVHNASNPITFTVVP
jgi:hypothetical protein